MKPFFLTILFLFSCISVFSQQDSVMKLSFPLGTKQFNTSEINELNNSRLSFNSLKIFGSQVYRKDSLLIYYRDMSYSPDIPGYPSDVLSLEDREKEMHLYSKPNSLDTSEIITVNNIRFLIKEYRDGYPYRLSFLSDSDKKHRYIGGSIEFKKSDEEKAWAYLNELLHSMHFKEK